MNFHGDFLVGDLCYNLTMVDKRFSFRNIAYQEKDGSFTGVCLDLDIVEEGHSTLQEAILSIEDAVFSHFKSAKKLKFPKELINRPAPKEYWDKLEELTHLETPKKDFLPFQFFTTHSPALFYA